MLELTFHGVNDLSVVLKIPPKSIRVLKIPPNKRSSPVLKIPPNKRAKTHNNQSTTLEGFFNMYMYSLRSYFYLHTGRQTVLGDILK